MIETEVSFTSLCCISEDYDGRVWLYRLADIQNEKLRPPYKSARMDNYFENRDRLYRNDGPSAIGSIGVWDWTAIPNRDNPAIDYVQSYYAQDYAPVRIVTTKADSLEGIVEQLKDGSIYVTPYICDTLFCYEPLWGRYTGVLCKANQFEIMNKQVRIKDDVYALPYYSINSGDIYSVENRKLRFLKDVYVGDPDGYISVCNTRTMVRDVVLDRLTWPLFKECIGLTKAEWRRSKTLLERICDDSLYEIVAQKLQCTYKDAKQAVEGFLDRANDLVDAGDIESDILAQIVLHHDELREQCEAIASRNWKISHALELEKAENELSEKRKEAQKKIAELSDQFSKVEQEVAEAIEHRDSINLEMVTAQEKLDQIMADIEQYETLGTDTMEAVRRKIAEAQKDMAGFLADISMFMPRQAAIASGSEVSDWKYVCGEESQHTDEEIFLSEDYKDEVDAITPNLTNVLGVDAAFSTMLSAFLYASHINHIPLLIAGPAGVDVAESLSVSLYGKGAGHLMLGDTSDCYLADHLRDYPDKVVSIQNMFGKGWNDRYPQMFARTDKQMIWTHPYVEDLAIEPKGLYNYMLPVLSECFVGIFPDCAPWPGKRAEKFKSYVSKKQTPLRISAFKRLGLSRLLLNRLTQVLSDAKAILNSSANDRDLEVLFGLLPLCVLIGRTDILKEVIESENGISAAVKAEARRYIEEV